MNENKCFTVDLPDSVRAIFISHDKKYLNREDSYMRVFQDKLLTLVVTKQLALNDLRVLICLLCSMEFENVITISQRSIGDILDMQRPNVNKCIKKLVTSSSIAVIGKIGTQSVYMINPRLAFKSQSKNYKSLVEKWNNLTKDNLDESSLEQLIDSEERGETINL